MKEKACMGTAPGRLDMLGGVADYSGALVLETPIRGRTQVEVRPRQDQRLRFESQQTSPTFELTLAYVHALFHLPFPKLRSTLDQANVPSYVRYILGGYLLLLRDGLIPADQNGLQFKVQSSVPISMGVSSSAALEVASLRALAKVYQIPFSGTELARLAQKVENEIVGAPCGLMDQLTCAHGISGSLLPILCRPDILHPPVPLPSGIHLIGWASGVKHKVSGSAYATARCATFMGFEILKKHADKRWNHPSEIPLALFETEKGSIPSTITGQAYLEEYGTIDDSLSVLDPAITYPVRAGLSFPIQEHARTHLVIQHLQGCKPDEETLPHIGEMMYASHQEYTAIGLGHPMTDRMVHEIKTLGIPHGFYGARVSGGGCGGTVVVLLEESALPHLQDLCLKHTPKGQLIPS